MKYLLYILFVISVFGCEMSKEFEIDLPETPKILGVYCIFSPDSIWKAQVFTLGDITDYEFDNTQLLIKDAQVKLFCDNQFQELLTEVTDGNYISSSGNKPVQGHKYHLVVSKENYPEIISDTASVLPKMVIDSIFIINDPKPELFPSEEIGENDTQLNIYFRNIYNFPFHIQNAGGLSNPIYFNYEVGNYQTYRQLYPQIENELNFYRCNSENCYHEDDFNTLRFCFVSSSYFDFVKGEYIQDDAFHSIFSYYPGNIKSNIKNGLGLFACKNLTEIDVDTLVVR